MGKHAVSSTLPLIPPALRLEAALCRLSLTYRLCFEMELSSQCSLLLPTWSRPKQADGEENATSPPSPCRLKSRVLPKSPMPAAMLCMDVYSDEGKRGVNFAVTSQGKHVRLKIILLRFPHINHVLTWWGGKKYPGNCHHDSCLADKHLHPESCIHRTLAKEARHRMMQSSAQRALQGHAFSKMSPCSTGWNNRTSLPRCAFSQA